MDIEKLNQANELQNSITECTGALDLLKEENACIAIKNIHMTAIISDELNPMCIRLLTDLITRHRKELITKFNAL